MILLKWAAAAGLGVLISGVSLAAENYSYSCLFGDRERIIEVVYPEGKELPCEVWYRKSATSEKLWSARTERGYCERKAEEFKDKQEGWGWFCEVRGNPNPAE